jgi:type II secretory ATPase GspE/PulE/Tfp pilus assembly ATPase PilB-like protein
MLAAIELPSVIRFPWAGLLILAVFAAVAAISFALAKWVRAEADGLEIPRANAWILGLEGVPVAMVVATVAAGPMAAMILGIVGIVLAGSLFARQRDAVVPEGLRVLTGAGLKRSLVALRELPARRAARLAAAPKASNRNWREWAGQLLQSKPPAVAEVDSTRPAEPVLKLLRKDGTPMFADAADAADGEGKEASENVKRARQMLLEAMQANATDIHFEAQEQGYFIRYRVDGVLQDVRRIDALTGRGVVSALKVVSDMNIAERRRPQDGTFAALLDDVKYDIRVASTPSSYGEKMVMRLLNSSGGVMKSGLEGIGLRSQVLKQLRDIIHLPYGMFLVAGPTGSGKTTTVYGSLSEIDAKSHNITTIEDPVEYRLDNITQIAVNSQAGVSFASILRSVLRQDPDVLLVGEIRDKETAEIACQAALTGHFVFSTIHANDSVATVTRLLDLGLEPTLIQTALTAVLAQRLARKLCTDCREPYPTPPAILERFKLNRDRVPYIYKEKGCAKCRGTGYRGRLGIHELLVMSDPLRKLITAQPSINDLRGAAGHGGTQFLKLDGMLKVLKGQTSVTEVQRVTT